MDDTGVGLDLGSPQRGAAITVYGLSSLIGVGCIVLLVAGFAGDGKPGALAVLAAVLGASGALLASALAAESGVGRRGLLQAAILIVVLAALIVGMSLGLVLTAGPSV